MPVNDIAAAPGAFVVFIQHNFGMTGRAVAFDSYFESSPAEPAQPGLSFDGLGAARALFGLHRSRFFSPGRRGKRGPGTGGGCLGCPLRCGLDGRGSGIGQFAEEAWIEQVAAQAIRAFAVCIGHDQLVAVRAVGPRVDLEPGPTGGACLGSGFEFLAAGGAVFGLFANVDGLSSVHRNILTRSGKVWDFVQVPDLEVIVLDNCGCFSIRPGEESDFCSVLSCTRVPV